VIAKKTKPNSTLLASSYKTRKKKSRKASQRKVVNKSYAEDSGKTNPASFLYQDLKKKEANIQYK